MSSQELIAEEKPVEAVINADEKELKSGTFEEDDVVLNPWTATGKFTTSVYKKVLDHFGAQDVTPSLIERFEKLTGVKAHRLLRRGLMFAHRDFDKVLDFYEAGKPIFLYTGRGPSSSGISENGVSKTLHMGHFLPMQFTCYLQKAFKCVVVFQIADDEKFWFKDSSFEEIYELGKENARDIIALGFDPEKTFMFSNHDFKSTSAYKRVADEMMKVMRVKDIKNAFGITDEDSVGKLVWPIFQNVAAFSKSFGPLFKGFNALNLTILSLDQDVYFRVSRDIAQRMKFSENEPFHKPCELIGQFLPALEGDDKMSTTGTINGPSKAIFLTDTPKEIYTKIKKYGFSGGQDTLEKHRELGGRTEVDVPFQWLKHFLEDDDELERIRVAYESGEMLTGEIKKICADVVTKMALEHQERLSKVTQEVVDSFYTMDNIKL